MNEDQLSLFDLTPLDRGRDDRVEAAEIDWPADVTALGARIPADVRFGTSTGWYWYVDRDTDPDALARLEEAVGG